MRVLSDFLQRKKHNPFPPFGKTSYVSKSHMKFRDRRGTLLSLPSTMLISSCIIIITWRGMPCQVF